MSICVSVKVSEGLVLATDSTTAVHGWLGGKSGKPGILKTYDHSKKLSQIKDYPIGTLTWGAGLLGKRSSESLIKEYSYTLPSLKEEQEKIKENRIRDKSKNYERPEYNVRKIAEGLKNHFQKFYNTEFAEQPQNEIPNMGILVSGYTSGKFSPEQWLIKLPGFSDIEEVRPDIDGKPDFGANWFGLTDAIVRLHWGRDDESLKILAENFKVSQEEIRKLLNKLQYIVIFDGMPLQDAIDYAVYLVNVVIGRFRFVVGVPLCGGDIDVSVITPDEFNWIHRKYWKIRQSLSK